VVKPDGTTITIALDGTITAVAPSNYWARTGTVLSPAVTGDQVQISISSSLNTPGLSLVGNPTVGFGSLSAASDDMFFAVNGTEYFNFSAGGLQLKSANPSAIRIGGTSTPLDAQGFIMQPQWGGPEFFNMGFDNPPAPFNAASIAFSNYNTGFGGPRTFSFYASENVTTSTSFPDLVIGTDGFTKFPKAKGIEFWDIDNTNYVSFRAPNNVTTTAAWTLPPADGTSGQVLSTNGTGALSWASVINYWSRTGTVLSPTTAGDQVQISGGSYTAPGLTVVGNSGVGFGSLSPSGNDMFFAVNGTEYMNFSGGGLTVKSNNSQALKIGGNSSSLGGQAFIIQPILGGNQFFSLGFGSNPAPFGEETAVISTNASGSGVRQSISFNATGTQGSGGFPDLIIGTDGNIRIPKRKELRFYDTDSSNYVGFNAPATVTSDTVWSLPAADGTSGQVLSTSGTGALSWASTVTVVSAPASSGAAGAAGQVASDSNYFYWYAGGGWQRVAKDTAPW
jgi:hypothetical protein